MRRILSLNENWLFTGPGGKALPVSVPHTWNAVDGQDGGDDYMRCLCKYEKSFPMPEHGDLERVYLQFDGVNSECEVVLNGQTVCRHEGGYSHFRTDVTEYLTERNQLTVVVSNRPNDRVYPQKADFTFYGGIYRDVELLIVDGLHFDLDHHGGPGIRVTAKPADGYKKGEVTVETWRNTGLGEVRVRLLDAQGAVVAQGVGERCKLSIDKVRLWNGVKDPYLYTAVAELVENGEVLDRVSTRFGVRDFRYHAKTGFYLNGKSYPLRGVSRHQDRKGLGNAITREMHDEDMAIICEMGANTIRLAHYQHDQYFYDLCDEKGMVVWAEIPYISEHMPKGRGNTISQMKELISQCCNHPSIVCWGVSNEITISTKNNKDMLDNHRVL
ncbi:MAG: glycoside hydrolase family 2 protein, partial [Oscillospiraceae bacterium]|nr:glycoside hydrolase family 2 protein [Oscillospiraceae bacterium]